MSAIKRAYYRSSIAAFLKSSESEVIGELATAHSFDLNLSQRNAWALQIRILQGGFTEYPQGDLFLEFSIPRVGKRVDAVLIYAGVIFVVEFKVGATSYDSDALDQVLDYALDLKNFHLGSHDKYLVPILLSTEAPPVTNAPIWRDRVSQPARVNTSTFSGLIQDFLSVIPIQDALDVDSWLASGYRPTPTIVEAARALYAGHAVEEISRSDAGAANLSVTTDCILEVIRNSRQGKLKSICFVTGVPGAGKTLAGLNISASSLRTDDQELAVFLSGNGPLVKVLREALVRDQVERSNQSGKGQSKKEASRKIESFIQNIHHFRDEGLLSDAPPAEHVVIFDEAQRAWTRAQAQQFMKRRGKGDFAHSEPEFLIRIMDRRLDWCTIVCLVGGGQEINTGEAGLGEWIGALKNHFPHWHIFYPGQISDKAYSWNEDLATNLANLDAERKDELHLAVSIRSFRAERLSDFVDALIEGEKNQAKKCLDAIRLSYPIVIARDLPRCREWLRRQSQGSERHGLIASSGAIRLKPEGINVKSSIDPTHWFLNGKADVRSSYYLEDAATEFDIQGLELDWTCVCWEADYRRSRGHWLSYSFRGDRWESVKNSDRRRYLANAYRVLLTRARQGMIIFVPRGDANDPTRPPSFYDETCEFLSTCGLPTFQ